MADIREFKSTNQLHQQLQSLELLFATLNAASPSRIRSQQLNMRVTPPMQRGCMYNAYSVLREAKLLQRKAELENTKTPPKKKVSFLTGGGAHTARSELSVAQSVPDFSAALRKENKKPNSTLETPPSAKEYSKGGCSGGSKSASVVEKKSVVRKSCVSLKELKGLSAAAASAIDEEGRGGRFINKAVKKTVPGHRQYGGDFIHKH